MAEMPPEAWIGEEVTVLYSPSKADRTTGILESVDERGIVLRNVRRAKDEAVYWYPVTSITSIRYPAIPPPNTRVRPKLRGF